MKTLIIIILLLSFISCYSQEGGYYFVDTTTNNTKSIYQSKNGFHFYPKGTYRIMSIFVNIIYDLTPWRDPYFNQSTSHWPGDTTEGFNAGNPTYFLQYLDTSA